MSAAKLYTGVHPSQALHATLSSRRSSNRNSSQNSSTFINSFSFQSTTVTLYPASFNAFAIWEPMNPAPPPMHTFAPFPGGRVNDLCLIPFDPVILLFFMESYNYKN